MTDLLFVLINGEPFPITFNKHKTDGLFCYQRFTTSRKLRRCEATSWLLRSLVRVVEDQLGASLLTPLAGGGEFSFISCCVLG